MTMFDSTQCRKHRRVEEGEKEEEGETIPGTNGVLIEKLRWNQQALPLHFGKSVSRKARAHSSSPFPPSSPLSPPPAPSRCRARLTRGAGNPNFNREARQRKNINEYQQPKAAASNCPLFEEKAVSADDTLIASSTSMYIG